MRTFLRNNFWVTTDHEELINASSNGCRLEEELKNLYLQKRITRTEFSVLVTRVRSMNNMIDNIGQQTVPNESDDVFFN